MRGKCPSGQSDTDIIMRTLAGANPPPNTHAEREREREEGRGQAATQPKHSLPALARAQAGGRQAGNRPAHGLQPRTDMEWCPNRLPTSTSLVILAGVLPVHPAAPAPCAYARASMRAVRYVAVTCCQTLASDDRPCWCCTTSRLGAQTSAAGRQAGRAQEVQGGRM